MVGQVAPQALPDNPDFVQEYGRLSELFISGAFSAPIRQHTCQTILDD